MKKELINAFLMARGLIVEKSPIILSGFAVSGLVTTAVLAHDAALKADKIIHEKNLSKGSWQEKAKATWKIYAPPVASGCVTTACIIGSQVISSKRMAALTGLYTLSETALREYQLKTAEVAGGGKAKTIKEAVAKHFIEDGPPENVEFTGTGDTLCYDSWSGRYFYSDIESIRAARNELNHRMLGDFRVSVNDLYYELNMRPNAVGDEFGWNIDVPLDITFDSHLTAKGVPVLVMDFSTKPFMLFRD